MNIEVPGYISGGDGPKRVIGRIEPVVSSKDQVVWGATEMRSYLALHGIPESVTGPIADEVLEQLQYLRFTSPFADLAGFESGHLQFASRWAREVVESKDLVSDFIFSGMEEESFSLGPLVISRENAADVLARVAIKSDVGKMGPDKLLKTGWLHPIARMYTHLDLKEPHKQWLQDEFGQIIASGQVPPASLSHLQTVLANWEELPSEQKTAILQGSFFSAPLAIINEAAYQVWRSARPRHAEKVVRAWEAYSITERDVSAMAAMGLDPFKTPFKPLLTTEAHLYCSSSFYRQCRLSPQQEVEALLADQHHFTAIKPTQYQEHPLSVELMRRRDAFLALVGWEEGVPLSQHPASLAALRLVALAEAGDKIEAFKGRSQLAWGLAVQVADNLMDSNLKQNYPERHVELASVYAGVTSFIEENRLLARE